MITGNDGFYQFEIESGKNHKLRVTKEEYIENVKPFSAAKIDEEKTKTINIALEKFNGISLYGVIKERSTGANLEGAKIVIIDKFTQTEIENLTTPSSGEFKKALIDKNIHDKVSYKITLEKEGYLSKTVDYTSIISMPGDIILHEMLNITLDKIELGMDIGKIINIQPIYFNLGKWDIRKDAQIELNKIIKVLNENSSMEIELGSHTDCRGNEAANLSLSDKRAKSCVDYIKNGINDKNRISGKGYGESMPVNDCACVENKTACSEKEHQINRRTEFKVIKQ